MKWLISFPSSIIHVCTCTNLEWLIKQVFGSNNHTPNHWHWVPKHIQAKDESVEFKESLGAIMLDEEVANSLDRLRLELQMEQTEPVT